VRRLILAMLSFVVPIQVFADTEGLPSGKVRVGAAAVELHGTDDLPLAGMMGPVKASGQDGMLRAVATVIQGRPHNTRVAIVALDIEMIGRNWLDMAANEIERKTGIPFDNVVINSTHTHYAPAAARDFGVDEDRGFATQVKDAVVDAVFEANRNLSSSPPSKALFIMGREATVGQNSRIELRDGTVAWMTHPEAEQLRPTGPFDTDFPVMAFKRPDRSMAAVIFGHSTHNVGTPHPDRRSPAFYGLAAQSFEKETNAITTFINGASGSSHLIQLDGWRPTDASSYAELSIDAERRILDAIRYHVDQAPEIFVARVGSIKREVAVSVRNFDEAKEEQAVSSYCKKWLGDLDGEKFAAIFRQQRSELFAQRGKQRNTWISATRIGDVAIVGVPAELFTQLGMDIKQRSPFRYTVIAELANDYVGYVGNADAYRLGGYQLWMGHHSWTERGTGELLVNEAVKLLDELYAQ